MSRLDIDVRYSTAIASPSKVVSGERVSSLILCTIQSASSAAVRNSSNQTRSLQPTQHTSNKRTRVRVSNMTCKKEEIDHHKQFASTKKKVKAYPSPFLVHAFFTMRCLSSLPAITALAQRMMWPLDR
jgi:hypothetical protein